MVKRQQFRIVELPDMNGKMHKRFYIGGKNITLWITAGIKHGLFIEESAHCSTMVSDLIDALSLNSDTHYVELNTLELKYINISTKKMDRSDGPAHIAPWGDKEWRKNGLLHRVDGSAVEYENKFKNRDNDCLYYINGKNVTEYYISWAKETGIDLDNLSDNDRVLLHLKWENYKSPD